MTADENAKNADGLDDPRLTAHAMGEASGPLSPEEQAEVEAIRATADALRAGFAATPMPTLDRAHRGAILQGLSLDAAQSHRGAVPGSAVRMSEYSGLGALAATLLLVVGLGIAGATGKIEMGAQDVVVVGVTPTNGQEALTAFGYVGGGNSGPSPQPMGFGGGGGGGGHQYRGLKVGGVVNQGDKEVHLFGPVRPANGTFTYSTVDIPRNVRVKLTGTLPGSLVSLRGTTVAGALGVTGPGGGRGGDTKAHGYADGDYRGRLENLMTVTGGPEDEDIEVAQVASIGDPRFHQAPDQDGVLPGVRSVYSEWGEDAATESFLAIVENPWIRPYGEAALSTFSIDVDTAGYSIVRRCLLEQNRLPPPGALRVEELVNYFPYSYAGPVSADPFAVHVDAAACPWAPAHRLVRIALKGRDIEEALRPAANLVFLLDVSGSMAHPNKLPLVQKSIEMLTERLTARDRVAMVVYAGQSGLVLPSTPAGDHAPILEALGRLGAGGSTNGGAGIELAYKVAAENFVPGGINRVVLATDGDFNVGVSDPSALVKMVEEKAKSGVFLTALGYGMDNLKDSTLEQLADKGNGNYGYIDNLAEARKVLVEQGMSTLHCIAKDVKIQVEFNPAKVAGYRLLGYENRMLAAQDFADDAKDAGEIGAGHTVTALYEIVPAGVEVPGAPVDELRYQRPGAFSGNAETLVVKLRWKEPEGTVSTPREFPFVDAGLSFESGSDDFRFAAAVAAFGMVLRDSKCAGSANLDLVREIAAGAKGADAGGYRAEFLTLVEKARTLKR